jgi:undecaprenyl diphosphate synthase
MGKTIPRSFHQLDLPAYGMQSAQAAMELDGLDKNRLPRHVAIIMDGNGRWAKLRGKSRIEGHRRGKTSVRVIVEMSRKIGIRFLTLYAFSTENWFRPHDEVDALMGLLEHYLVAEQPKMMRYGIRLVAVGDRGRLPTNVRNVLERVIDLTRDNARMTVVLALSYSGRDEIVRMVQSLARLARDRQCEPEDIDEALVAAPGQSSVPDPDLLIRTSGECASAISTCGRSPTANCTSRPPSGRISAKRNFFRLCSVSAPARRFGRTDEQVDDRVNRR